MYLPKSKYKQAKHTRGGEYSLKSDSKPYTGYYFETYENRFFTGKTPTSKSVELIANSGDEPPVVVKFNQDNVVPTPEDRNKGRYIRYFLKDTRTSRIIEVYKSKFYELSTKTYIHGISLSWTIKGPAEDINIKNYIYEGAINKNKKSVEKQDNLVPGLKDYIKDYGEFVE